MKIANQNNFKDFATKCSKSIHFR